MRNRRVPGHDAGLSGKRWASDDPDRFGERILNEGTRQSAYRLRQKKTKRTIDADEHGKKRRWVLAECRPPSALLSQSVTPSSGFGPQFCLFLLDETTGRRVEVF